MKNKINHFCITGKNYPILNDLGIEIILSGAISKNHYNFPNNWHKDCDGINISKKNKNFGTLTSHYWIWKNKLSNYKNDQWIGINHYRRFWIKKKGLNITRNNLKKNILRFVPKNNKYEVFLPKKIHLKDIKLSKLIKKGFNNYIRNPKILFNRKKISINLHFDLFHGYNLLTQASQFLESKDRNEFLKYIKEKNTFYPLEMFICQKKNLIKLYEKTFKWIFKCEKFFKKKKIKLTGYSKERLYDFLAERYFSFYFENNLIIKSLPIILIKGKIYEI